MHTTGRNTLLIALFVVVFAATFAQEAWQAGMSSNVKTVDPGNERH